MSSLIREHVDRCIELWATIDDMKDRRVSRETHEQMRADLMILVGIVSALEPVAKDEKPEAPF